MSQGTLSRAQAGNSVNGASVTVADEVSLVFGLAEAAVGEACPAEVHAGSVRATNPATATAATRAVILAARLTKTNVPAAGEERLAARWWIPDRAIHQS